MRCWLIRSLGGRNNVVAPRIPTLAIRSRHVRKVAKQNINGEANKVAMAAALGWLLIFLGRALGSTELNVYAWPGLILLC